MSTTVFFSHRIWQVARTMSLPSCFSPYIFYISLTLKIFIVYTLVRQFTTISTSPNSNFIFPTSISRMENFVQRQGTQLVAGDVPYIISGFNTYWLMVFAADLSMRSKVSEVFREAAEVGLNACRTWAFNDGGWRALQVSPLVYDEDVFKGLDFVISEARNHNIRLILSFCNNWGDYGGKPQYVKWGKEAGLELTGDDDFFSDPTLKSYYKAFVQAILTRVNTFTNIAYMDDPTILAWELINEPQCPSDPSGDILQAWIEEMAAHVKSIDSRHMLEIGEEGYYGPSVPEKLRVNPNPWSGQVGTDFIRNHQVPGIDFASVHIYSDAWLPESATDDHLQFVQSWMDNHLQDGEKVLKMPVVFSEFGVSLKDDRFTLEFRENFLDYVYKILKKSNEQGGVGGGCLIWQLFPEGTDHMDDGYAVILAKHLSTRNMLIRECKNLQSSLLKGVLKQDTSNCKIDSEQHEEL